jgi:hypothetical protein
MFCIVHLGAENVTKASHQGGGVSPPVAGGDAAGVGSGTRRLGLPREGHPDHPGRRSTLGPRNPANA